MKRALLLSGAALALAACSRGEARETTIETAAVERRDIIVDAQATGVVEPINIVEVKSKSSGQIVQMPVEVGSEVAPGDLLVQLDTRDVKNQYDQAAADLEAAEARLRVAESQRKRSQELFDAQIITRQEYETSGLEHENAKAQIIRTRSSLDLAAQRLEEATVRAPVIGTVIEKPVSLGQVIASATGSASGGTTILKMADLKQVRVRALVNESDIGAIQAGMEARVIVDAYPDRPFWGTVEKVEPQAVVQQSVTMFPVLVSLNNSEMLLKPGMNGEVSVTTEQREGVLAVPNDAIRTMRELASTAAALGLDPESAQAMLRSQMRGGMGGPAGAAPRDTGAAGQQVRVAPGDVEQAPAQGAQPRGQGGRGAMPQVSPEQCAAVTAALEKNPQAAQQLQQLRERMLQNRGDTTIRAEMQKVYATLGVDGRTATACTMRQRGDQAAPGGAARAGGPPQGGRGGQAMRQGGFGGAMGGAMGGGRGNSRSGLVFVAKNGTYEPRMVRLGASDFDFTEVVSGLEEGEQVALLAVVAIQAARQEQNDRMRRGTSLPGMSRNSPQGGAPAGGAPAGGARPGGR